MKKHDKNSTVVWRFVLLCCGMFLLLSCGRRPLSYPSAVLQAENIIDIRPDSALTLLGSVDIGSADVVDEVRMYHRLLTIKAEDKLYVSHHPDSLQPLVDYYVQLGDNKRLAEAYFYQGSAYRDMNNVLKALEVFHQAAEVCEKASWPSLLGKIYGQIGSLFLYQRVYDEALDMYLKAKCQYGQAKDSLYYAGALCNIARVYSSKHKTDSTLYYYKEAIRMCHRLGYTEREHVMLAELGCYYCELDEKALAKPLLQQAIRWNPWSNNVLLKLGDLYETTGQPDSARYCFKQVVIHGNFRKQRSAYLYLSHLEEAQGNASLAATYHREYRWRQDSIDAMDRSGMMEKQHLRYSYKHEERKNQELSLKSQTYLQYIWSLLLCVVVLIVVGVLVNRYIHRKKQTALEQEIHLRRVQEQKLQEADANNSTLQGQLQLVQKEMEELSHRHQYASGESRELLEEAFRQSEIYLFFHKVGNGDDRKVTEAHWAELRTALDTTYSNLTDRLYALYPQFSQQELRICYLIKMGISVKGISLIVGRSRSSVSLARSRLYKKIHKTDGTAEMLDRFVLDF